MANKPKPLFLNVQHQDIVNSDEEQLYEQKQLSDFRTKVSVGNKSLSTSNSQSQDLDNFTQTGTCWGVSTKKCSRDYQCDRYQIQNPLRPNKKEAYFAVYDGHLTGDVAEYLSNELHQKIVKHPSFNNEVTREKAFLDSCAEADNEILNVRNLKGGSTAVISIIIETQMFVVNVGDSLSKMVKKTNEIQILNNRHEVGDEQEKQQLLKKGACILDRGNIQRINGKLAVSRSFGDSDYKQYITSIPDTKIYQLNENDEFLLLASDGFWDYINDETIINEVKKYRQRKNNNQNGDNNKNNNINLQRTYQEDIALNKSNDTPSSSYSQSQNQNPDLSRQLLDIASDMSDARTKKDNMTLIVVDIQQLFQQHQTLQKSQPQQQQLSQLNNNNLKNNNTLELVSNPPNINSINVVQQESCGKISPEQQYPDPDYSKMLPPQPKNRQLNSLKNQFSENKPALSVSKEKSQQSFSFGNDDDNSQLQVPQKPKHKSSFGSQQQQNDNEFEEE